MSKGASATDATKHIHIHMYTYVSYEHPYERLIKTDYKCVYIYIYMCRDIGVPFSCGERPNNINIYIYILFQKTFTRPFLKSKHYNVRKLL